MNIVQSLSQADYYGDDNAIEVEHNPVSQDSSDEEEWNESRIESSEVARRSDITTRGITPSESMGRRRFSSAASGGESEHDAVQRIAPQINCQEKIIICLDLSSEMDEVPFKLGDGSIYSPLYMAKRVVEMFVRSKSRLDPKHEYALVSLNDTGVWLSDYTNDPKEISHVLEEMETNPCRTLDLSSLFELIEEKIDLPTIINPEIIPPPYVVRMIMVYGRSHCIPTFLKDKQALKRLLQSHYFFLDVFYIHIPPNEGNRCEDIFDALCELDEKGTSYIVEVSRNPTKLHDSMAKLLAHPLQRPLQREVVYRLSPPEN